jgi:hypothetical protein
MQRYFTKHIFSEFSLNFDKRKTFQTWWVGKFLFVLFWYPVNFCLQLNYKRNFSHNWGKLSWMRFLINANLFSCPQSHSLQSLPLGWVSFFFSNDWLFFSFWLTHISVSQLLHLLVIIHWRYSTCSFICGLFLALQRAW